MIGFSEGANVAAAFIAQERTMEPASRAFKCAIFICGGLSVSYRGPDAEMAHRLGSGPTINVPTGHILGSRDDLYAAGVELSELCSSHNRLILEHSGGHEIPKGEKATLGMVQLVNDVIARALFAQ